MPTLSLQESRPAYVVHKADVWPREDHVRLLMTAGPEFGDHFAGSEIEMLFWRRAIRRLRCMQDSHSRMALCSLKNALFYVWLVF